MSVWILLFLCMMTLPLVAAMLHCGLKKGKVLEIRQDYVRNARYFGKRFAELIEKALPDMKDGVITLSHKEEVLESREGQTFPEKDVEKLVLARESAFCPKESGLSFHKEIYSEKDALFVQEDMYLRAVYSKKRILFGNGVRLLRWADAEEAVVIYDGCELGRRVSSGNQLVIGFDNTFQSLYAPVIRIGQRPEDPDDFLKTRDFRIFRLPVITDVEFNRHYIHDDMISESGTVPYTIISRGDVKVIEDLILQGDIHSDGAVRIMEGAAVLGNIFAEKDVLLERNTSVLGNVFTQGNIILEEGASVGQPDKISSVIARDRIRFQGGNYVFGYVAAEGGGSVLKADREAAKEYIFPKETVHREILTFRDLDEYLGVDMQGFRLDLHLKEAVIPDGAAAIPASQFFGCRNLGRVRLPKTISVISDYAFADCIGLRLQGDLAELLLKKIGTSAFENCRELTFSALPDSLEEIGGAAFADCAMLQKLIFPDDAMLKRVGDHAFRDCTRLEKVFLPDGVEYVGVSAFLGCCSLEEISMSVNIKDQRGIAELKEICPKARIIFRPVKKDDAPGSMPDVRDESGKEAENENG